MLRQVEPADVHIPSGPRDAARAGQFRRIQGTTAYVAGLGARLAKPHPFEPIIGWSEGHWNGHAWRVAFGN
ncbi:MAG TPA: hypothetical protein PLQ54_06040, partial [Armatimonadota bacterium]|nr:hypothetical protein [Armatimonadota bacterium]